MSVSRLRPSGATTFLVLHAALYIVAVLAANLTAEQFIHFPVFGQLSVGTFFFGLTFTQRDRIHGYGRGAVYTVIALAALTNVLASLWLEVPWRILLASFAAIVLAETADTEVYQRLLRRPWLARVAASNAVSMPIDSTLFTLIAFAGDPAYPPLVMASIIFGDVLFKTVVGLLFGLWRSRFEGGTVAEQLGARG